MEYRIVRGSGDDYFEALDRLELLVRGLVERGWRPQGGVALSYSPYWSLCFRFWRVVATQAVVRKTNKTQKED